MSNSPPSAHVRDLALAVFETNGRLVDAGNELVRPIGLTTAWWQVLGALGYSPQPLPVAHIARNMGLTRQAVQRVVNLLLANGLVSEQPNPHHQRAKLIVLTTVGRAALAGAETAVAPLDQAILDQIGADRLVAAVAVLREMNAVIADSLSTTADPAAPSTPKDIA
ncbi:MarR family transcriptional regulator [Rhizobium sp. Leaf306]|uniref:MarR family winged helix-turn-helix transcriptional regulator n=1 Tax=unclassified Rhizobium TaxID=2613769 RepID=UPI000712AE51|nr:MULTISPECIES: MarR family winged helix-turn-helix transcriptional regulator [unclassified Rhizobium]KQQ38884.1 MarR family transcriptional regulator [Rhizobium sp. Leaf306]KQQ69830.1 MarR family transcriptional regulator [Rhizobium sp. Leaf321]